MWNYLKELTHLPLGVRRFLYSEPLFGIAMGLMAFLLNFHFLEKGLTEIQIGQLTSLQMIVMGLTAIPLGIVADRFNRKVVFVTGIFIMGGSFFLFGIVTPFEYLALVQAMQAFGLAVLISAEIPLLYHYCDNRRQETQTYNMMFAIFTLFTGVGTLLGGVLPDWLPQGDTRYEYTLYVAAFIVVLVGIIRAFLPPDRRHLKRSLPPAGPSEPSHTLSPSHKPTPASSRYSWVYWWRSGRRHLPSRNVFLFVGFSFFAGGTFGFLMPYFNVILKFRFDQSDEWVSLILTINGLFLFAASFFTPLLLDRWGLRKSAFWLLGSTTLITLLLAAQLPMGLFVVLFLLRNGGYMATVNLLEGQSLQATKDSERGLHSGMRSVARSTASTLAAFGSGYILNLKNYTLPFLLTGLLLIVSFVYVQYLMIGRLEKELSHDPRTLE